MEAVDSALQSARAGRQAAAAQEEGPARDWAAAQTYLERLTERVRFFEQALAS